MKKILSLICVSALGGVLTLGGYKLFIENNNKTKESVAEISELPVYVPTNNLVNTKLNATNFTPSFVEVSEKSIDAVVHVKNTSVVSGPTNVYDFFYGRDSEQEQVGTGSGVIISPTGYIVTNNHVIDNATEISITLNNNKVYSAELIGNDEKNDIALLKIETDEDLPFMAFGDSDNAKIGEWVLAVGNPFNLNSTVTAGIISAKSRDLTGRNTQSFIQTDAAVNPGNSGGALVNTNGDLIGINTAISTRTGSYIGYSFAVPSNIVRKIVNDIIEFGNVQNGILGISALIKDSEEAIEKGLNEIEGVYVNEVQEETGASEAGIKSGDIIKKVDHVEINKFTDLTGYLRTKSPKDVVNVTYLRDGEEETVPVTLLKPNTVFVYPIGQIKNIDVKELKKYNTKNGIKISNFANERSKEFWNQNGIKVGDIITKINGNTIYNIEDAQKELTKFNQSLQPLRLEVINSYGEKITHSIPFRIR